MLQENERQEFNRSSPTISYSCVIVCAAPQAPENMVNIDNVVTIADFRPKTSLSFDQIMIIARRKIKHHSSMLKPVIITCVGNQVPCDDPSHLAKALQIVCD